MKQPERSAIRGSEWDFSKCPDEELIQCVLYEYYRESEAFRHGFEKWKKALPSGKSGSVRLACWKGVVYVLRSDCAEFPNTPWLDIPQASRAAAVQIPFRIDEPSFERAPCPARRSVPMDHKDLFIQVGLDPSSGHEKGVFEIKWGWPNEKIIADFRQWITRNRPDAQAIKKQFGVELTYGGAEFFGRGNDPDFSSHLKALGAFRLLKRLTADQASDFTQRKHGQALFEDATSWSEAKKKAEAFLSNLGFPN